MKKLNILILILLISVSCSQENNSDKYAESITSNELSELLYEFASDEFEGRNTGEPGQKLAVNFIRDFYKANDIVKADNTEDYFQKFLVDFSERQVAKPNNINPLESSSIDEENIDWVKTENVAAIIKGDVYPNEYIVLTAHLDHVGIEDGEIYNGADDDGSGSMALLEIAQAFKLAELDGNRPKRSIVILHVSAEEKGLLGSKYYAENPLYPLNETITNLNVDMIGRTDPTRESDNDNYIYLIGTDRLSSMLHETSEKVNSRTVNLELDYRFNAWDDPNRFYERSDHFNFAKNNIPVIFYFSGTHEDYHGPGDTPDKIRYDLLTQRSRLIFHTAWEIANMDISIEVDQK
ncbi:M28 family metallopeptidase [Flavobacteriaceae bacterium]|nr:M28 family metallopeptidase [Flavobacteriaceae bacterium]MDC0879585.1 M28 family metallopeptidase [Flavobacteriaceae bacterium]